jgi:hypothetical protein
VNLGKESTGDRKEKKGYKEKVTEVKENEKL